MGRNFFGFLIIFVILQIFIINVDAKIYECEYEFTGSPSKETWLIEYDTEKGSYVNKKESKSNYSAGVVVTYEYNFEKEEIKGLEQKGSDGKNFCPILYVIYNHSIYGDSSSYSYKAYSDSYLAVTMDDECYANKDKFCFESLGGSFTSFYVLTLTDSEINKNVTTGSVCTSYDKIKDKIESSYSSYSNCNDNNCANHINNANSEIDKLKSFCNKVLSYLDVRIEVNDNESVADGCVSNCLNLKSELKLLKEKYEIEIYGAYKCDFSERLISFIANILKWIKYILPVIVMVLGILDFIKALSSEKDDEMKKAQGRFMKRLIAAALVFLIPLIIEFVLNKMGFDYNECGLF